MIKKGLTTKYNQPKEHSSARLVKLQKITNTLNQKNKQESAFTSVCSMGYNAQKVKRKIQINDEIINRRKQNFLNTQYNRRLNQLKTITKQNKKIYQRINSQKSLYSQDDMRRSSVSIRSLSRSSSRVSNQSIKNSKAVQSRGTKSNKNKIAVTIQPESVTTLKQNNIKQFKSVFMIEHKNPKTTSRNESSFARRQNKSFSLRNDPKDISMNMNLTNYSTNNTHTNVKVNVNSQTNISVGTKGMMGNMLHKIAEEMYIRPENKKYGNSRKKYVM